MLKSLQLEYSFQCPIKIIYDRIATASGLSEWYADDVVVTDNVFKFIWDDTYEEYLLNRRKPNKSISFKHIETPEAILEFALEEDEFTKSVVLTISIDVEEEDAEDITELITSSVDYLKELVGSN